MTQFIDTLVGIFQSSGFAKFGEPGGYLYAVMICVGCFLLYLAIVKEFEPLILLPMAFGMILANLPGSGVIHMQYFVGDGLEHPMWVEILNNGGLADMLYMGVKLGIYPPLIFLGIGTMTDFAPLISNPKSLLLGAAAQFGIFGTYMGARLLTATGLVDFTQKQSAAIAIIGGADGPTAIFVTSRLAPELLGSIAVAAFFAARFARSFTSAMVHSWSSAPDTSCQICSTVPTAAPMPTVSTHLPPAQEERRRTVPSGVG